MNSLTSPAPRDASVRTAGAMRWLIAAAAALAFSLAPWPAGADTLNGALEAAYRNNPSLNAVRAAQRALDENVAIARSAYRPQLNGNLEYGIRSVDGSSGGPTLTASIGVDQTLFDGFRRQNDLRGARAGVFAGQEGLKASTQDTLLAAAQAYVTLVRDRRIVDLRRRNIAFFQGQLDADRTRFEVGEVTRTDVAATEAALAEARADAASAAARVRASEAVYRSVTGQAPGSLAAPRVPAILLPN